MESTALYNIVIDDKNGVNIACPRHCLLYNKDSFVKNSCP